MIKRITTAMLLCLSLGFTSEFYVKIPVDADVNLSSVIYTLLENGIEKCKDESSDKEVFVLCGPYSNAKRAKDVASKVSTLGYISIVVEKGKRKQVRSSTDKKTTKRTKSKRKQEGLKDMYLGIKLRRMYDLLNKGDLDGAETYAYSLINSKYKDDALMVIGIVNMRRGYDSKACKILALSNKPEASELKDIACLRVSSGKEFSEERKYTVNEAEDLKKAIDLFRLKKYEDAIEIAKSVLKSDPTNLEAILIIADSYMLKKEYEKALPYYKMAFSIDSKNVRAIKGLMYSYMALGKIDQAYKYSLILEKMNVKDDGIRKVKALYYAKKAEKLIDEGKYNEAMAYLKKARDIDINEPLVNMLFGDIYFKRKDYVSAYKHYMEAYKLSNDFNVLLKVLYTLTKMHNFDLVNDFLAEIELESLTEKQRAKLKEFYKHLYVEASSYYLDNNNFSMTYKVAKEGLLMFPDNETLRKNLAWACLNLDRLDCAKENFLSVLSNDRNDKDSLYGLALVYVRKGENQEAKKYLRKLEKLAYDDPDMLIKIADLYALLGDTRNAKRVLRLYEKRSGIKDRDFYVDEHIHSADEEVLNRKEMFEDGRIFNNPFIEQGDRYGEDLHIKRNRYLQDDKSPITKYQTRKDNPKRDVSYTHVLRKLEDIEKSKHADYISLYTKLNSKSGRTGLDELNRVSLGLDAEKAITDNISFWTYNSILFLNSGGEPNYGIVGSLSGGVKRKVNTSFIGIEPMIGLSVGDKTRISVGVGSTPIGNAPVNPTFRYLFNVRTYVRSISLDLLIKRDSIRDSLLSYVGLKDPYSSNSWGRVLKEGGRIEIKFGSGYKSSQIAFKAGVYDIKGKNVNDNNVFFLEFFPYAYIGDMLSDEDYIGLFAKYENYNKDENLFYFGNGGYFSPKNFLLIGPKYTGYVNVKNLLIKLNALVGFLSFEHSGGNVNSLSIDISSIFEYKLGKNTSIVGGLGYRNSRDYDEIALSLGLKYYFRGLINPFRETVDTFDGRLFN